MSTTLDTVLGRAFASAGADAQAEVLNAAGTFAHRTYDTEWRMEAQGAAIADRLNEDGWRLLRCIALFDPKRKMEERP